ncbi:MAG: trigger factor [Chloroflexota bacterium]
MKVETQIREDHQAQIVAEFEPEALAAAKRRSAQQLSKRVKVPGFRPGKAPYAIIERTVGEEAILESAIELLVQENYPKILDEAKVEPYDVGTLEEVVSNDPPIFRFVIPLRPEVTLGEYRSVRRAYEQPVVGDDDVARVLRNLQERQAIVEPVDRPVQAGDQVTASLGGRRKQVEEGQDAELFPERSQTIDIAQEGDDVSNEWPFPGFSQNLMGMSAGDEKSIAYTYPDDYDYEALRTVEAEFHVKIEDVKARTLPELDDEFAQGFGEFSTIDDLKARIRENLEQQSKQEYDQSYTDVLIGELLEQATIQYPPQMLEKEIDDMIERTAANMENRGMNLETYLKTRSMDAAAFRAEVRPSAEERLKRSLLLMQLSREENVQINPSDVQMQAYQAMSQITQNLSPKDARKATSQEFVSGLVSSISADLYMQATLDRLREIATGELEARERAAAEAAAAEPRPVEGQADAGDAEGPAEAAAETEEE